MSDLFADLGNFRFPDTRMNQGPLPSVVGGPAGSDGTPDGVINGTNKLLGKITPYAMGEAARTGSDRNYQQVPHRVQQIVQQVAVPDPTGTALVHIPHVVDNGELAFILLSNDRSIFASPYHHYGRNNPPSIPQFGNLEVVNYILCCLQMENNRTAAANVKNLWQSTFQTLLMGTQRPTKTPTYDRWKALPADRNEKIKFYFDVAMYLVSTLLLPFGICAGSEKQGGQHEGGFAPVQSAVNYVTTMTVDGQNRDLMNYWHGHTVNGGDRLILTLQLSAFTDASHVQPFSLNSYYKKPVAQSVMVGTEPFWQLKAHVYGCASDSTVPGIDLGDYDYRRRGYWHIAQTFQCRKGDRHKRGFENAPPLQVTFSPMWQRMDQFKGVPGPARLPPSGGSSSGSVPIPPKISTLLGKYPDLYGILLLHGIHILQLNGPLGTQEVILKGAGMYSNFETVINNWALMRTARQTNKTIQSLYEFSSLCIMLPSKPLCDTMKVFTQELLVATGVSFTAYRGHSFPSTTTPPNPVLVREIDTMRGTFSAVEDEAFLKFLTALCESPKDYIDESNEYAKHCLFLSSLFYICGIKINAIQNMTTDLQKTLTIFSNARVNAELIRHVDVANNTALQKDIFKTTSYYLKANRAMKVVADMDLEKYFTRKVDIETAETNIKKNELAFEDFVKFAKYDVSGKGTIYDETKLFAIQYKMMSEFEVRNFEWTTFKDALNVIIIHINKGDVPPEQLNQDKNLLQSMQTPLNSYYERRRCLLVYTTLYMHQIRTLVTATTDKIKDYGDKKIGDPLDITQLKSNVDLTEFISALNLPDIQMIQTYDQVVLDIQKVYTSFKDHTVMRYIFQRGGWLQNKMGRTPSTAKRYNSTHEFDEGEASHFYLGDELGTFGTRGCASSGGAALAGVASVSSRDDGVPGESGDVAMSVVEEAPKTVARRASKKIRFDVDARYPSIAEEAAGGESAA
jgi:hypothetical protein